MDIIIFFFGPDGSGKTTLVNNMIRYLSNDRYRVIWFRGSHTFASIIARFISKFQMFKGSDNPYYNIIIPIKMRSLWRFIEFTSFIPILVSRIMIPRILGYKIICERSIPDFIAWIILTLRDPNFLNTLIGRFLIALSQKTKYLFYITASIEVLKNRRMDMDESIIKRELIIYDKISNLLNAYEIDTSDKDVEESVKEILNYINMISGVSRG